MRRRSLCLILVVLVVLAGVIVVLTTREREPEYKGKRLSEWVRGYGIYDPIRDIRETDEAIRHIGTNALPYLLKWVRYERPSWRTKFYAVVNPLVGLVAPSRKLADEDERVERGNDAAIALIRLGAKAEGSVGELADILNDAKAPGSGALAAHVLSYLGPAGLPPLYTALTNQQPPLRLRPADFRCQLAKSIGRVVTNALPAVPSLILLLSDPDERVRRAATNAIRRIDPEALERAGR